MKVIYINSNTLTDKQVWEINRSLREDGLDIKIVLENLDAFWYPQTEAEPNYSGERG